MASMRAAGWLLLWRNGITMRIKTRTPQKFIQFFNHLLGDACSSSSASHGFHSNPNQGLYEKGLRRRCLRNMFMASFFLFEDTPTREILDPAITLQTFSHGSCGSRGNTETLAAWPIGTLETDSSSVFTRILQIIFYRQSPFLWLYFKKIDQGKSKL